MTSSLSIVDVKNNILGRAIYPPSHHGLKFIEVGGGRNPTDSPGTEDEKSLDYIALDLLTVELQRNVLRHTTLGVYVLEGGKGNGEWSGDGSRSVDGFFIL